MKLRMMAFLFLYGLTSSTLAAPIPDEPATPVAVSKTPACVRISDIARAQGARDNQLLGYGLVIGLKGTGDGSQSEFTALSLSNMLKRLNITIQPETLRARNVAAVIVTADIPPFARRGDRIDLTVSSVGNAASLQGGTLVQTPLQGADGQVYAVAQGTVSLGGYTAASRGTSQTSGHPTVGRIPGGALVEAEIPMPLVHGDILSLSLHTPSFTTAARMAKVINDHFIGAAKARDAATVDVTVPAEYRTHIVDLMAKLGDLTLVPDAPARVVINERTGTVVIGGAVRINPVAIAQGSLTVTINTALLVSQPVPLSEGTTIVREGADIAVEEPLVSLTQLQGGTVEELVRSLNALRVSPNDIIAILQALKQAGALQAEFEIM